MWHDQYLMTSVERTVRDAQQMLENTDRTDWGVFIVHSDEGQQADEYFAAFRAELLRQLAPLIVEQHESSVVLGNGRRRMRFEIGREFAKERLARIQAEERTRASEHHAGPVRYQSDYANQVHQLIVSVSRHLWVTKEGLLRYQHKPFEVSLAKLARAEKRHIVHYLIRDHHSGLLYAEIAVAPQLFSTREFLLRAWSRKDRLSFSGVPDALTVPKSVADAFPELLPWLDELDVEIIAATSGFQAGVRDLKTWEEKVRHALDWYPADDLGHLPALAEMLCWNLVEEPLHQRQHVERWRRSVRTLRYPTANEAPLRLIPEEWRTRVHDQFYSWLTALGDRYADHG
jgi:hypothetical protein